MHDNPAADWRSLAEHYRSMYDKELENLADDFGNLTETAQQVLRNELSSRDLPAPGEKLDAAARQRRPSSAGGDVVANQSGGHDSSEEIDPAEKVWDEDGRPREFTWKTLLCECETTEQALGICTMLKQAGIDSWYELPGGWMGVWGPRVIVGADQLEQAQEIAAKPIPQDILDDLRIEVPEYESPRCPACRAVDPTLKNAEPTNSWLCEVCGKQWTEPAVDAMGEAERAGR
jgi:hypothetical protein